MATLDPSTHAYSFWEGVPESSRRSFGRLFRTSQTLQVSGPCHAKISLQPMLKGGVCPVAKSPAACFLKYCCMQSSTAATAGTSRAWYGGEQGAAPVWQAIAVGQRAMRGRKPEVVMEDLGFGPLELVSSFSVAMAGAIEPLPVWGVGCVCQLMPCGGLGAEDGSEASPISPKPGNIHAARQHQYICIR